MSNYPDSFSTNNSSLLNDNVNWNSGSYGLSSSQSNSNQVVGANNIFENQNELKMTQSFALLEPRLQEYVRRKALYKKNNINVSYPLEKTYNITQKDMIQIRRVLNNQPPNITQSQTIKPKPQNSIDLKINKRYDYRKDPLTCSFDNDKSGFSHRAPIITTDWKEVLPEKPVQYSEDNNYCKFAIGEVGNPQSTHTKQSEIDNASFIRPISCSRKAGATCDENDAPQSKFDTCLKTVFPNQLDKCYTDQYLNTSFYKAIPFMGNGSGIGDLDMANSLRNGEATRTSRHKKGGDAMLDRFEFLDRDIQDPEHIVMDGYRGGYDSRQTDKLVRRNSYKVI